MLGGDRRSIPTDAPPESYVGCVTVAMSDVGHTREENQDFMKVLRRESALLLIVSDGMGGHSGGFEASRTSVAAVARHFEKFTTGDDPSSFLTEAVVLANKAVRSVADSSPFMEGMGATIVMAMVVAGRAWIAHVGDSRAYLLRSGALVRLTADHSRVFRLYQAGLLTEEQAENHPMSNIIERSVGVDERVVPEIRPDTIELCRGDRLFLCTDGISGLVRDPALARIFATGSLLESVKNAIDTALEAGGTDNATVAALEVVEGPESAAMPADARPNVHEPQVVVDLTTSPTGTSGTTPEAVRSHGPAPWFRRIPIFVWILVGIGVLAFLAGLVSGLAG